jgi:hypothetical protein
MAIEIITMYKNNIIQNYISYISLYIDVILDKKEKINTINNDNSKNKEVKKNEIKTLNIDLIKIKDDLMSGNLDKTSDILYHPFIDDQRRNIIPYWELQKNNLKYDLKCKTLDYLPYLIFMMKIIENREHSVKNVFPLRSSLVPSNVRIDTLTMVTTLLTKDIATKSSYRSKSKQNEAWDLFFRTNLKCFHRNVIGHNYTFYHQIITDGVSCSILLIRKDLVDKKFGYKDDNIVDKNDEIYIDKIKEEVRLNIINKKVVGIDPNMGDLLFCVDGDNKDQIKFRYSNIQRNKETKSKKYRKIREINKKNKIIDGYSVSYWEGMLGNYSKTTLFVDRFKQYLEEKNKINQKLASFYQK